MHNTEFELGTGDELHQNEVGRASTRTFGFPFMRCLFIAVFLSAHLTLSLLKVINVKFLLQPQQKYYITQYGEPGFS